MNPILARYDARLPFSVQERDIDLVLVEQLHVSSAFADWLTRRLNLTSAAVETARHSVYREHGETDVLVIVRRGEERVAVMIEDKIGAPMQPGQCERYHLRGRILCEESAPASSRSAAAMRTPTIWISCERTRRSSSLAGACRTRDRTCVRSQPCRGWRMRPA